MRRTSIIPAVASLFVLTGAIAGRCDTPRPAQDIMSAAQKEAKAKKKPIFVLFDASW